MNLLVVGASYRTAELPLLERLAVPADDVPDLLARLLRRPHLTEAAVLSTCNRVEVYAVASGFHGGVNDVSAVLAEHAGTDPATLAGSLYLRWDADAVTHALRVAAGLDSMVTGESQILGQFRAAYHAATAAGTTGRLLHELMQHALRVGKRIHAETAIGASGRSVVTAALEVAAGHLPDAGDPPASTDRGAAATLHRLRGRPALVIGTGSMGALAVATLARAGAGPLYVATRDPSRRTAAVTDHGARPVALTDLARVLPEVELVVSATASPTPVLSATEVAAALHGRPVDRPLVVCDLAVPRDVEPAVADLPGVRLIDTGTLVEAVPVVAADAVAAAEEIVAEETGPVHQALADHRVAPTVAALRLRADEIVEAELSRLRHRRPDLTDEQRSEVAHAMHRLVQRLLHQPTVRVRQFAGQPGGESYARVLAELFDLQVPRPDRAYEVPSVTHDDAAAGGAAAGDRAAASAAGDPTGHPDPGGAA